MATKSGRTVTTRARKRLLENNDAAIKTKKNCGSELENSSAIHVHQTSPKAKQQNILQYLSSPKAPPNSTKKPFQDNKPDVNSPNGYKAVKIGSLYSDDYNVLKKANQSTHYIQTAKKVHLSPKCNSMGKLKGRSLNIMLTPIVLIKKELPLTNKPPKQVEKNNTANEFIVGDGALSDTSTFKTKSTASLDFQESEVNKNDFNTKGNIRKETASLSLLVTNNTKAIIRRSMKNIKELDVLSVTSSSKVDRVRHVLPEEIQLAARNTVGPVLQDMESYLELKNTTQICTDFEWTKNNEHNELGSFYQRNFQFHMGLEQHPLAIRLLRFRVGRKSFPSAAILHHLLNNILQTTNDRVTVHRSLDVAYRILALHPPGEGVMRQYYWSVMTEQFNDRNPRARWNYIRELIEDLLDGELQPSESIRPTRKEVRNYIVAYFVHILKDDLKYWLQLAAEPNTILREKKDVPLIARLLWPFDMIGNINGICKELIGQHCIALEKNNRIVLPHTTCLIQLMNAIVQLCDIRLPLKLRKPGESALNLAREMGSFLSGTAVKYSDFFQSIRSSQLRLLLSLSILSKIMPQIEVLEGSCVSLQAICEHYIGLRRNTDRQKVIAIATKFKLQPSLVRYCVIEAVISYTVLFSTTKILYYIRHKYHGSSRLPSTVPLPNFPRKEEFFSASYTRSDLVDDLSIAKLLLTYNKDAESFFSLIAKM